MVAEDDAISREMICAWLEKWGYEALATENGMEAMGALEKDNAPSLAILDWMMPGMDGLQVCRRVRELDRSLYILLLTARGTEENVVEGLNAGADDYLIKPLDKDELRARVLVGFRMLALKGASAGRSGVAFGFVPAAAIPGPPQSVKIDDLCEGQVLAEDVLSANGLLILRNEVKLTPLLLVKLRSFRKLGTISGTLLVH